jgi:predicted XRE-type DNA-binding protein
MPETRIRKFYRNKVRNSRSSASTRSDAKRRISKKRARADAKKRIIERRKRKPKARANVEKHYVSPRRRPVKVEIGSGNVFADIGLPNPEEALAKAEIARRVNLILSSQKLSQVEAGNILGISQPRVSDLARGRLGKFSLEKLIDFAKRLGNDIEIRIQPSRKPRFKVMAAGA